MPVPGATEHLVRGQRRPDVPSPRAWLAEVSGRDRLTAADCRLLLDSMASLTTPWGTQLGAEYEKPAGVFEGYTLRQHDELWLNRLVGASAAGRLNVSAPQGLKLPQTPQQWSTFMAMVGVLHDAGKAKALEDGDVHQQHEYTLNLLNHLEQTRQMPWSSDEFRLARVLIDGPVEKRDKFDGDSLGAMVFRIMNKPDDAPEPVPTALRALRRAAAEAGFAGPEATLQFYQLQMVFYQCDATSYSMEAGGLHSDPIAKSFGLPVSSDPRALREVFGVPERDARQIEALHGRLPALKDDKDKEERRAVLLEISERVTEAAKKHGGGPSFIAAEKRLAFAPEAERGVLELERLLALPVRSTGVADDFELDG